MFGRAIGFSNTLSKNGGTGWIFFMAFSIFKITPRVAYFFRFIRIKYQVAKIFWGCGL